MWKNVALVGVAVGLYSGVGGYCEGVGERDARCRMFNGGGCGNMERVTSESTDPGLADRRSSRGGVYRDMYARCSVAWGDIGA